MAQFKDKAVRGGESAATAGLFAYPVLQAADILLYQADRVPIGDDQRQHLELTRTLAQRFNTQHPGTFQVPEPLIAAEGARVMELHDPRKKMSKSSKSPAGLIRLIDSPEAIRSKITCATIDSGHDIRSSPDKPGISNLISIYTLVSGAGPEHIESTFSGKTYADFKSDLADTLVEYLRPFRERFEQLSHERGYVERILLEVRIVPRRPRYGRLPTSMSAWASWMFDLLRLHVGAFTNPQQTSPDRGQTTHCCGRGVIGL